MDAFLRALGRFVFSSFFRRIEIVGQNKIPNTGPVVIVANHFNSLVDGAILTTYLPRMPRFLAASIVLRHRTVVPILRAAGSIPVFRHQDAEGSISQTRETIRKTADLLAAGGVLATFPEGRSHNEPSVQPVKSGTARIILEAEQSHGPLGVKIVPVGLVFEEKSRIRSRVLIQIGEPFDASDMVSVYSSGVPADRAAAVRALTERIQDGLSAISPNFGSWKLAHQIERVAGIWERKKLRLPKRAAPFDAFRRRQAFGKGYEWLRVHYPSSVEDIRRKVIEYESQLGTAHPEQDEIGPGFPAAGGLWFAVRSLLALFVGFPILIAGLALNALPYFTSVLMSRRADPDQQATWQIFSGVVLFPLFWLLQAVLIGWTVSNLFSSIAAGLITFAAALPAQPVSGRLCLWYIDLCKRLIHGLRIWMWKRTHRTQARQLDQLRQSIAEKVVALMALYETRRKKTPAE